MVIAEAPTAVPIANASPVQTIRISLIVALTGATSNRKSNTSLGRLVYAGPSLNPA